MNEVADAVDDWEAETKPAEESLKRLAAAMPQGVALLRDERVVWASERLAEMAGWGSASSFAGTPLSEIFADRGQGVPDAQQRAVECTLRRANGQELTVVCRPAWPEITGGTDAWVVEDTSRIRELEADVLRMGRDLHRANRELASLRDQLEQEGRRREELLGVVSHELRTPLTVIGGYARLLLSEEVGPLLDRQRRFLLETQKSCVKLDGFVERLLQAARQPEGGEVLEVASRSLAPLVREVSGAMEPLLEKNGVALSVQVEEERCRARFDPTRVEQILTNLLGNAIRYARGRVEIAARPLASEGPPLVEVSVADDGPGVPPQDRERILEPYVQAGARVGGLGLGLAICRRLVEAHGGTLRVDERPGGGARFAFTLPAAGS